jgi:hypothetical protein
MKFTKLWNKKAAVAFLSIAVISNCVAPAMAVDTSGDPMYTEINTAIAKTQAALASATSLSFEEHWLCVDAKKNASKTTTRLIVTPTVSEYFNQDFQSRDKQKTWQTDYPLGNHVYISGGKVYTVITKDQSFGAGGGDFMISEIRNFAPFKADWVVSDQEGPLQNYNALDPIYNAPAYTQGLAAVNSYLEVVNDLPLILEASNAKGENVYSINFNPQIPKLSYTYTVNPISGYVTSMGFNSVTEGTKCVTSYDIALGDAVQVPTFDPATLNSIDLTEITKRVRGLTAANMLKTPAQLVITQTNAAAKKLHKKVTSALVSQTATKLFGKLIVSAVPGGIKLKGTYQGEVGFQCVLVKNGKISVKACS